MEELDAVQLNFNQDNIALLNFSLGFIMFGVALNLRVQDFIQVLRNPKSVFVGVFSQFLVLPLVTFMMVWIMQPIPSVALGMMIVAACPGGNISNFMTSLAKGNAALSVSLTAFSTVLAIFMTPLNVAFWGSLYEPTASILREVSLNVWDVFKAVVTILGIPLVLGMLGRKYFSSFADLVKPYMQIISILIFVALVAIAFSANFDLFLTYIKYVIFIVLIHNAVALFTGYQLGRSFGLPLADRKTLSIETGIQNSGLGLLLIFNFFEGLGGMAIVAAWWGIWHIISGLTMAYMWNRKRFVITT